MMKMVHVHLLYFFYKPQNWDCTNTGHLLGSTWPLFIHVCLFSVTSWCELRKNVCAINGMADKVQKEKGRKLKIMGTHMHSALEQTSLLLCLTDWAFFSPVYLKCTVLPETVWANKTEWNTWHPVWGVLLEPDWSRLSLTETSGSPYINCCPRMTTESQAKTTLELV